MRTGYLEDRLLEIFASPRTALTADEVVAKLGWTDKEAQVVLEELWIQVGRKHLTLNKETAPFRFQRK